MPPSESPRPELRTAAVIGLGYVGLPLCRALWQAGYRVLGIDSDPAKIEMLLRGESYLTHLGPDFAREMTGASPRGGTFSPRADAAAAMPEADAVLICVPTPLDENHEPDLRSVERAARQIAEALRTRGRPMLVVLESTTWPGTTREVVAPILDEAKVPYHLAFSPERVNPGETDRTIESIPKLVGGVDAESTAIAAALYRRAFAEVVEVESAEIAEAAKLLENVYRAVNIALVNELKVVLDRLGIDIWPVIEAAKTKPYGFQAFYPGPGLGGHCIPIDPFYLSWKARQAGTDASFIELAGRVNRSMPQYVVSRTLSALGNVTGRRILILGLAYKANVDDVRESPSFELIRLFREAECIVEYSDPHVPRTHPMRHYGDLGMSSVPLSAESLASYDAVVVATDHAAFDWALIAKHARLIVDTRNALRHFPSANVLKA